MRVQKQTLNSQSVALSFALKKCGARRRIPPVIGQAILSSQSEIFWKSFGIIHSKRLDALLPL
jgi:hypothetical protein